MKNPSVEFENIMTFAPAHARQWGSSRAKRCFDILSALCLLLIAAPLMVLAALAIRLESRGPALYRQERVGQAGKVFTITKLRSMRVDAEVDGKAVWAVKDDPRVTRVGRFIRKTRIDELPQLFAVLQGTMSLVGPRPERPEFVELLNQTLPGYSERHAVKPGITGWAQVRHHYGASERDAAIKLDFDMHYVENQSLSMDLRIMAETVVVVLTGRGAH